MENGVWETVCTSGGRNIAYGAGRWVAVGAGTNRILYSNDGITWNTVSSPQFSFEGLYVMYSDETTRWIAIGASNTNAILYSNDGINWTASTTIPIFPPSLQSGGLVYGGGKWVVAFADASPNMLYSNDGITWNATLGTQLGSVARNLAYGGGRWVAVGSGTNKILYSDDGIRCLERNFHQVVAMLHTAEVDGLLLVVELTKLFTVMTE
jgi:hypothetical protein